MTRVIIAQLPVSNNIAELQGLALGGAFFDAASNNQLRTNVDQMSVFQKAPSISFTSQQFTALKLQFIFICKQIIKNNHKLIYPIRK